MQKPKYPKDKKNILTSKFAKYRRTKLRSIKTEAETRKFFAKIQKQRKTSHKTNDLVEWIENRNLKGAILEFTNKTTYEHKSILKDVPIKVYQCLEGKASQSSPEALFKKPKSETDDGHFKFYKITDGVFVPRTYGIEKERGRIKPIKSGEYYCMHWAKLKIPFDLFEHYPDEDVRAKLEQFKLQHFPNQNVAEGTTREFASENLHSTSVEAETSNDFDLSENEHSNYIEVCSGANSDDEEVDLNEQGLVKQGLAKVGLPKNRIPKNARHEQGLAKVSLAKGGLPEEGFVEEGLSEAERNSMIDYFACIFIVNCLKRGTSFGDQSNCYGHYICLKLCRKFGCDKVDQLGIKPNWYQVEDGDISMVYDRAQASLRQLLAKQFALALSVVHCSVPNGKGLYLAIMVHLIHSENHSTSQPQIVSYLLKIRKVQQIDTEETRLFFNSTMYEFALEDKYLIAVSKDNLSAAFDKEMCAWLACANQTMLQFGDTFIDKLHSNKDGTKPVSFDQWRNVPVPTFLQPLVKNCMHKGHEFRCPAAEVDNQIDTFTNVRFVMNAKRVVQFAMSKPESDKIDYQFKANIETMEDTSLYLLNKAKELAPCLVKYAKRNSNLSKWLKIFLKIKNQNLENLIEMLVTFKTIRKSLSKVSTEPSADRIVSNWIKLENCIPANFMKRARVFYSNCMQMFEEQMFNNATKMACLLSPVHFSSRVKESKKFNLEQQMKEFNEEMLNITNAREVVEKFRLNGQVKDTLDMDTETAEGEPSIKRQKATNYNREETIEEEFVRYRTYINGANNLHMFPTNSIDFWFENRKQYQKLSQIALFYLSIPASCVPSEIALDNAAKKAQSIMPDCPDDCSSEQLISLIINHGLLKVYLF